jgi:hypothetical protein
MKRLICFIIFCSICFNPAFARWASFEDASMKSWRSEEVTIDETGRLDALVEMHAEILKEPGRAFAAHYNLTYNGANTKIEIIEAKTIYQGKEYKLEKRYIEDKPLASSVSGFDQFRQILLAFPKPEIGAKIYLKYKYIGKRAVVENFYSGIFTFGDGMWMEKESLKLQSKIPLYMFVNDPENILQIKKDNSDKNDSFYNLEIKLSRPLYKGVIGEPEDNVLNKKYITYVSISSLKKPEDLAMKMNAQGYDKILTQDLPKDFVQIKEAVEKQTDEVDQINLVTSQLNGKIQYMGDWRSIEGKFIPRSLAQISKTQLGDCKDFSASTVAILAKLGYKARVALVRRGVADYFYPNILPSIDEFNHAIVKVIDKKGNVRWIDPTNFVSMADGIFPDIAGKMAFVLDSENPTYERIPDVDPLHAESLSNSKVNILEEGKVLEVGEVNMRNENALWLTGTELNATKKTIRDGLFAWLTGEELEEENKISMTLPDLKSRVVKDVAFNYSYKQENKLLKTNLGPALKQSYNTLKRLINIPDQYVQDILVSAHPFSVREREVIKNVKAENVELLNKEIKTPWLYVKRHCSMKENDLHIDYDLVLYKNLITNEETKKPEFIKLKKELEENFKDTAIVVTKLPDVAQVSGGNKSKISK